jgi:hypothetical protein
MPRPRRGTGYDEQRAFDRIALVLLVTTTDVAPEVADHNIVDAALKIERRVQEGLGNGS